MENFFIDHKEWIAGIIASVVMFFTGRKSKKISEESSQLQNLKTIRELEKQLVEDVKNQIIELREINTGLLLLIEEKDEIIDKQQEIIDQQRELILDQRRDFELLKKKK